MADSIQQVVIDCVSQAKRASASVGLSSTSQRNKALELMAQALRMNTQNILDANARDMQAASDAGTKESLLDRLMLDGARIDAMACALEDLINLPDPLGCVLDEYTLKNGLNIQKISVPLGVVAVIYEARPNVTADAAGIAIKAGNAVVLRGGSMAQNSNRVIAQVLAEAAQQSGMPKACISSIDIPDREATRVLMQQRGFIDVLVPRGGAGLISSCVENSMVPVIETGTGNCHIYVQATANQDSALEIIKNAKTQRMGVCNAAESVLIDSALVPVFLPQLLKSLACWGILIHADSLSCSVAAESGLVEGSDYVAGHEDDWACEYLGPEISVCVVDDVEQAVRHINKYSTHHSDCIVSEDKRAIEFFLKAVDSAAVYANASTRFTDGGEFGMGAEIGISTQKLHVRGPFALQGLTTYKYVIQGTGQVRL